MITRRDFAKYIGSGALALGIGEISMGFACNPSSVFADIEAYVPIGLDAFKVILGLISPSEASALGPIINDVEVAFNTLETVVQQYQNAPASQKASLVGKIVTAINAVISQLNSFWSALNLPDGSLASTIIGVLQVIVSTLAAFLPQLGGTLALDAKKKFNRTIPIVTRSGNQLKAKSIRKDINAVFAKYGYSNRI